MSVFFYKSLINLVGSWNWCLVEQTDSLGDVCIQWINSTLLHSWSIYSAINSWVPCPGTDCIYLAGIFLCAVNILYILLIQMTSASGNSCIIQCTYKMGKIINNLTPCTVSIFNSKITQLLILWILFDCQWLSAQEIFKNFPYWFFWLTGFATKYKDEVGCSLEFAIHFDT